MADRKLYDYDGNIIPTEPVKKLYDYEGKPFQSSLPSDNTIGRHLVEALPMAGAIAGGTLGPLGGAAGTGLGTMVKQSLQKLRPDLLGEAPSGGTDIAADTGKELLLNNVLPGILGKAGNLATRVGMQGPGATAAIGLSHFPAVREGAVSRMTKQIQEMLGENYSLGSGDYQPIKIAEKTTGFQPISVTPNTAEFQPIRIHPRLAESQDVKFIPKEAEFQPIKITPGQEFKPLTKSQSYQPKTKPTVTAAGVEKTKVPDAYITRGGEMRQNEVPGAYEISASGPRKTVPSGGYTIDASAPMKQVGTGEFETTLNGAIKHRDDKLVDLLQGKAINAEKSLDELLGKNAATYADAMSPETHTNLRNMLESMKDAQKETRLDRIIRYQEGRLVWTGMGAALGTVFGHTTGGGALGLAARETPVILNSILGRIMANPETAKLVTAALRTPAKAPQADLINKALTVALPRLFLEGTGVDTTSGK